MLMVLKPPHLEVLRMLEKNISKTGWNLIILLSFQNHRMTPSSTQLARLETWNIPHISITPCIHSFPFDLSCKNHPNFPAASYYSSSFFTWIISISLNMFSPFQLEQCPLIHPPVMVIFLNCESHLPTLLVKSFDVYPIYFRTNPKISPFLVKILRILLLPTLPPSLLPRVSALPGLGIICLCSFLSCYAFSCLCGFIQDEPLPPTCSPSLPLPGWFLLLHLLQVCLEPWCLVYALYWPL